MSEADCPTPRPLGALQPIPWSGTSAFLNESSAFHILQVDAGDRVVGWNAHAGKIFDPNEVPTKRAGAGRRAAADAFTMGCARFAAPASFDFVDRDQHPSAALSCTAPGGIRKCWVRPNAADDARLSRSHCPWSRSSPAQPGELRKTRAWARQAELDRCMKSSRNLLDLKKMGGHLICMTRGHIKTEERGQHVSIS